MCAAMGGIVAQEMRQSSSPLLKGITVMMFLMKICDPVCQIVWRRIEPHVCCHGRDCGAGGHESMQWKVHAYLPMVVLRRAGVFAGRLLSVDGGKLRPHQF